MEQVMAVTKDEATQTNIAYASKIGKQVIKAKINETIKALDIEIKELKKEAEETIVLSDLSEYIYKSVMMSISSDGEITRLRNLVNKFNPHGEEHDFKTNAEIIQRVDNLSMARRIFGCSQESPLMIEILEKEHVYVEVNLNIEWEVNHLRSLEFLNLVDFSKEWMDRFAKHCTIITAVMNKENEVAAACLKLSNIDDLVEEMEARLLVDDLQSTEQGKKVLAITSSLVANVLGETPDILKLT